MSKQIFVDANYAVDTTQLDDVDSNVFIQAAKKNATKCTLVAAFAERLGYEVVQVDSVQARCYNPFEWVDTRGATGFETSPEIADGRVVRFEKHIAQPDTDDKRNLESNFGKDPAGWPELYCFKVSPDGLTEIEVDLLSMFAIGTKRCPIGLYGKKNSLDVAAMAEMARRLGLKPVFDETITPE